MIRRLTPRGSPPNRNNRVAWIPYLVTDDQRPAPRYTSHLQFPEYNCRLTTVD